jgi:hypothetical protein
MKQYLDVDAEIDKNSLHDMDLMLCDLQAAVKMGFVLGEDIFIDYNEEKFKIIIDEKMEGTKGVLYPKTWMQMSYIISALEIAGFKK